jgi:integrase
MRWDDPDTGKRPAVNTGTADRTLAETIQKAKWAELNIPGAAPEEPEPEPAPAATWEDCRTALSRAMEADSLRPSYVNDALITFDGLRTLFPSIASPSEVTPDIANEYKRQRAESGLSPWSIKGDLATLKAVFGKWLGRECGLLAHNPFATVNAPKCDEPDIRIVTAAETGELFAWLATRWNNWRLPGIYLEVAALVGWRATEIASMREDDILDDGFIRVGAESSKTRRHKFGWLPAVLHAELKACSAGGWAFGRFSDDLRRLLMIWKGRPHHAARVRDFAPARLVGWLQDELQRFHESRQAEEDQEAKEQGREPETVPTFTLHDFRRTAITGLQMAGVSEKEASVQVGCTPEVMRRHYERLDGMAIARRNSERRLAISGPETIQMHTARLAGASRVGGSVLDGGLETSQTVSA